MYLSNYETEKKARKYNVEINLATIFCRKYEIQLFLNFHSTFCIRFISLILNSNTYFANDEIEKKKIKEFNF